jgi:uncharacterized protein YecE (DUF72 family)
MMEAARVGIAGWALRREHQPMFDEGASHLARYATRFNAVEINSSFYRRHRAATYARWAASVPETFRFSVKVPKAITHAAKLTSPDAALDEFLGDVTALGATLGCLLVQLPPSLQLDPPVAEAFFVALRARVDGPVALEPRHTTWASEEAEALFARFRIARVAADPPRVPDGDSPGGWPGLVYYRMHGSPRTYYSTYDDEQLAVLADAIASYVRRDVPVWCIFDNTALGAATPNALELRRLLER